MNYQELHGHSIREGFKKFNSEHPHIYEAFEMQVFKALSRGRKKLSAKLIINWIRWNETLKSSDPSFKINDAFQSYYARHFVAKNPKHKNVFEFRKLRNEQPGSYAQIEDGKMSFHK